MPHFRVDEYGPRPAIEEVSVYGEGIVKLLEASVGERRQRLFYSNYPEEVRMAKAKRVTYFVANLEDKPGSLLKFMLDLKSQNIGLVGLWGYGTTEGRGMLYAVAKNPDKLRAAWKGTGVLAEEGTGFMITGSDRTGALVKSLEAIAGAGINIRMMDAIAVGGRFGSLLWVDASQIDNAAKALGCK